MILSQLREYLKTQRRASLADMALHFRCEPDALRGMLNKWVAKGRVEKLPEGAACASCCQCEPERVEIYEWTG
ncbi:FeoC-like transcriptional regulator [Lentisalinibacter sediminis]|uniref:FeoC-like transcriptional regulator n=1 Tax=Lentisalinibacter sediminis TaxID=2992237 RepID=UPI0038649C7C